MKEQHCMHYIHDYSCDDHVINHQDCSTCAFRKRTLVDLDEVLKIVEVEATDLRAAAEEIQRLRRYSTLYMRDIGVE